jgi:hypothetical protein
MRISVLLQDLSLDARNYITTNDVLAIFFSLFHSLHFYFNDRDYIIYLSFFYMFGQIEL